MWSHSLAVFSFIKVDQIREKRFDERRLDQRVAQIDSVLEAKVFLMDAQARPCRSSAANRLRKRQNFAPQGLTKLLRSMMLPGIDREIAGSALQKEARRTAFLFNKLCHGPRIVG